MTTTSDETTVLPLLRARLDQLLDPQRAALATGFAKAAWRRLAGQQPAALDVELAAARIVTALDTVAGRRHDELGVAVVEGPLGRTEVRVVSEDGPFLLSTVSEELARRGLEAVDVMHPVFGVERDAEGHLAGILPARAATLRETYLLLELPRSLTAGERADLEDGLRAVLEDARVATRDFLAMKEWINAVADRTEVRAKASEDHGGHDPEEVVAFLRWVAADHFVVLGTREYAIADGAVSVVPGSGLGILRDEASSHHAEPTPLATLPPDARERLAGPELLVITRSNRRSTVHRQARMVYVGVKALDEDGRVAGEHRIIGLFSQKAFAEPASTTPVLRAKLRAVLDLEDVVDHSYDERAIRTLFDSLPKGELFSASADELRTTLMQLIDVSRRGIVRLLLRPDEARRACAALVTIPRQRFNGDLRLQVQQLLADRLGASGVDYQLSITEGDQPLLHFTLHDVDEVDPGAEAELETAILALTRTWSDEVRAALAAQRDPVEAARLCEAWLPCLPASYSASTDVATAIDDLGQLEALAADGDVRMRLHQPGAESLLRFRLYKAGDDIELSSFVPLLESLGLVVVEEVPFDLAATPLGVAVNIHDYGVRSTAPVDVLGDGPRIARATLAMWEGRAAVDLLNRLVVAARLEWGDVAVLRAYRRYRSQVGTIFTESYTDAALVENPAVARALLDCFASRFDPDLHAEGEAAIAGCEAAHAVVVSLLDRIERLDTDRILRGFLGMVDATLRTNRWRRGPVGPEQPGNGEPPMLALKLASAKVPDVPLPVPHVEVFVYSPGLEGIHLRGGPVARGGLRWSDRSDDFRTEVLGLMKAQMTKNAVIVPTGSKGGFVLKRPPADPAALKAEVQRQYQVFIRGLLDVTDNVVGGRVVPPPRVVRADGDDPYLVVAADRGTATFSDVANAISQEYGFWLGDAFASGGSAGYDHKAMGITARGAWVAVQRHFRELNSDVQTDPVTVVGVGDMSGDVFGNGLLRSRTVKLLAAFDHRHVFVDPDPDAEVAFQERQRLYDLPASSWNDYDRGKISAGGGVWPRAVKAIPLSAEMHALLRTDATTLPPPDLIQALLRAPVDLLFFGGIGTFVKASEETHADVGDRANDAIRVDANQLGVRVVGEGGNLAMTQRARIAFARRGGRVNTDAVDNSAGVDTSDHEVNLKILLGSAVEDGGLDLAGRDALQVAVTDEIAGAVLRDVYLQTWLLSQELVDSPATLDSFEQLMAALEQEAPGRARLDRTVEVLPDTQELIARRQRGAGLVRPELAVLTGYAKAGLSTALRGSSLVDQPAFDEVLLGYFPERVAAGYAEHARRHRLRREIVATVVANDVVNRMGITYVSRTAADLGLEEPALVGGYWAARTVARADARWRALEALDGWVDPVVQLELKREVDRLVDALTRDYGPAVRSGVAGVPRQGGVGEAGGQTAPDGGGRGLGDVAAAAAADAEAFARLEDAIVAGRRRHWGARAERWLDLGLDEDLAVAIAVLPDLAITPSIAATARAVGRDVVEVGEVFAGLGTLLPLEALQSRLAVVEPAGRWQRWQHRGLADDLRRTLRRAAAAALRESPGASAKDTVAAFLAARADAREAAEDLAREVVRLGEPDLDAVAVAVRALIDLVG